MGLPEEGFQFVFIPIDESCFRNSGTGANTGHYLAQKINGVQKLKRVIMGCSRRYYNKFLSILCGGDLYIVSRLI